MKFGLLDTHDNVWMGDNKGPKLFDDEELAQVAARIVDVQLRQIAGRTKAMPYIEEANIKRDKVPVLLSPEEALKRLEEGLTL